MATARPHDPAGRFNNTDEEQTFKKAHQTVDRPPVTDHNINDEYYRHPPHNETPEFTIEPRQARRLEEGASERTDSESAGILGNQEVGKQLKEDVLQEITTENSVHPHHPPS